MVDAKATGISSAQSLTVVEKYQLKPGLPFVPEIEISDVVRVISDGANSFAVADAFSAGLRIRKFAENIAVRAIHCRTA